MLRRPTNPGLQQARHEQRRATLPFETNYFGRVQDKYPAYEDFPWEKIEEYLRTKWPTWKDFKPTRFNDNWQFEVPEKLTEGDKKELRNRRDAPYRRRRASVSPEPELEPQSRR